MRGGRPGESGRAELTLSPQATPTVTPAPRASAAPAAAAPPVTVTLHDCLACSGCVTSAETVLLEAQSVGELDAALAAGRRVVVAVSAASVASLAAAAGVAAAAAAGALAVHLRAAGVSIVLDDADATALALEAAAAEACARFAASERGRAALARHGLPGAAEEAVARAASLGIPNLTGPLPVLAGACPGWVCYAEKSQPAALPHASSAASPQAVAGAAVKGWLAAAVGWGEGEAWVASVQPCADKKLEAVRDAVAADGAAPAPAPSSPPGVDCVLTTMEMDAWLRARGAGLGPGAPRSALDSLAGAAAHAPPTVAAPTGTPDGSGGWAEHVFRVAAARLFGVALPPTLSWTAGRNADARTLALPSPVPGAPPLFTVAVAHGFRNIQTAVRRLGGGEQEGSPAYIEMMACPRGCANGGGQVRGEGALAGTRAALAAVAGGAGWVEAAAAPTPALAARAVVAAVVDRSPAAAAGRAGGVAPSVADDW